MMPDARAVSKSWAPGTTFPHQTHTKTWLDLTLAIPVDSEHGDGSPGLFLCKLTQDPED